MLLPYAILFGAGLYALSRPGKKSAPTVYAQGSEIEIPLRRTMSGNGVWYDGPGGGSKTWRSVAGFPVILQITGDAPVLSVRSEPAGAVQVGPGGLEARALIVKPNDDVNEVVVQIATAGSDADIPAGNFVTIEVILRVA